MKRCNSRWSLWSLSLSLLLLLLLPLTATAGVPKRVRVLDKEQQEPLPAVQIRVGSHYLSTDNEGIALLPSGLSESDSLTLRFAGYQTLQVALGDLPKEQDPATLYLRFMSQKLGELQVEERRRVSNTSVGEFIDSDRLQHSITLDLSEVLQGVKGISIISSGGDQTPAIHGMYGDRILILNQGVRQEAQQWSTQFAPKVSMLTAGQIAVMKGAEAVRYGADALGGVILLESAPLPFNGKLISGIAGVQYESNGRAALVQLSTEGAIAKAWAWRVASAYLNSGDRSTAKYLMNNTGARTLDLSAHLGWQGERANANLFYSFLETESGSPIYAQMGNADLLKERLQIGYPLVTYPFGRNIDYPKHHVIHQFVRLQSRYSSDAIGSIGGQIAYLHDRQREYHIRRNDRSEFPSISLTLQNLQAELLWEKQFGTHWQSQAGLQGNYINNFNEPGTGVVPLIPNYVKLSGGLFWVQKYIRQRWSAEIGLRYDRTFLSAIGYDVGSQIYGGKHLWNNFTFNAGFHYFITPKLEAKTHVGTAWRPPNVAELYANGLDVSGALHLKGEQMLRTEQNLKWITTLTYKQKDFSTSIEGYLQRINGYIYRMPQDQFFTTISGVYPTFHYTQTKANMHGIDGEVTWLIPRTTLQYQAVAGMIWANETETGNYLPLIAPFHLDHSLAWQLPWKSNLWQESTLKLTHHYSAEQKRFDPATDLVDSAPPAYHLFGLEATSRLQLQHGQLHLQLTIDNLFNKEYKNYLSLARYYAHDLGRDVRLSIKYLF